MAVFTVTTAADVVNPGDGVLSLREAVARANATGAADTIRFAASVNGETLTLTQGRLTLTQDTTVGGTGSGVTVDGNSQSRVFAVGGSGTDVAFTDIAITGGQER